MTGSTTPLDREYYESVETYVEVANDHPRTPAKIGNRTAIIGWDVAGTSFHMSFSDGAVRARPGGHPKGRIRVETDPETLCTLLRGDRDITNFVGEGAVRVVAGEEYFHDLITFGRVSSACADSLREAL